MAGATGGGRCHVQVTSQEGWAPLWVSREEWARHQGLGEAGLGFQFRWGLGAAWGHHGVPGGPDSLPHPAHLQGKGPRLRGLMREALRPPPAVGGWWPRLLMDC